MCTGEQRHAMTPVERHQAACSCFLCCATASYPLATCIPLDACMINSSFSTGLPEEVSHTKQCLARGYAVLALMSLDRSYRFRCFSSSGGPDRSEPANRQAHRLLHGRLVLHSHRMLQPTHPFREHTFHSFPLTPTLSAFAHHPCFMPCTLTPLPFSRTPR
jgi:hypothetical protein